MCSFFFSGENVWCCDSWLMFSFRWTLNLMGALTDFVEAELRLLGWSGILGLQVAVFYAWATEWLDLGLQVALFLMLEPEWRISQSMWLPWTLTPPVWHCQTHYVLGIKYFLTIQQVAWNLYLCSICLSIFAENNRDDDRLKAMAAPVPVDNNTLHFH